MLQNAISEVKRRASLCLEQYVVTFFNKKHYHCNFSLNPSNPYFAIFCFTIVIKCYVCRDNSKLSKIDMP
jgi:hypothetical protein